MMQRPLMGISSGFPIDMKAFSADRDPLTTISNPCANNNAI